MKNVIFTLIIITMVSCKPSVIPVTPFGCDCDSDTTVSVEAGDISQLQFGLTAVDGVNLISVGDFASSTGWTAGAGWSIGSGIATYNTTTSTLSRPVDVTLTDGYYCVEVKIISGIGGSLEVKLGGVSMSIITAMPVGQRVMLYGYVTPSNNLIELIGTGATGVVIDNVKVIRMSELQYDVLDCESSDIITSRDYSDGDISYIITGDIDSDTDYYNAAPKILIAPNIGGGTAVAVSTGMITIDWLGELGLDEGCYRICVKDNGLLGYEYIRNGNFQNTDFWSIANTGAGWSISAGEAKHVNLGGAGDDVIGETLLTALSADMCYILTFDFDAATSWNVTITGDTATTSGIGIAALAGSASAGTQTVSIPAGYAFTDIHFASDNVSLWDMDNVSIKPDPDCVPCSCETMCLEYRDSHDYTVADACNMLIKASNDNNGLGYNFEDFSFEHQLRVFGKFRFSKYDYPDEQTYKFTDGVTDLISTGYEKFKELQIYQMPEGMHDIFSLMLVHQNFSITIDGEERNFVKRPGSIAPIWTKVTGDAPVIVELIEKTQNRYNYLG